MAEDSFDERADRRRRTWKGGLASAQTAVQASETTPAERLACMRIIAESAWAMTGLPLPSYTRATMPGRVIRGGR